LGAGKQLNSIHLMQQITTKHSAFRKQT